MVGSLAYLRVKQRSPFSLVVWSTLAIGIAYLGLAAAGTLLVACLISIVGGAGNGIQWIAVMTTLQERTPSDYQARITGLMESLGAAMPGVGYLLGGAIVALASPRTAYAVAGIGVCALVLAALPLRRRIDPPNAITDENGTDTRQPARVSTAPAVEAGTRSKP